MECAWDAALLQRGDQLPPDLLETIRNGSNEQYLESITKGTLDPRYTYILFAHCEDIFAHVCSRLRNHGNLASVIATLGRIIPFAPHLSTYAERLLKAERYSFQNSNSQPEDVLYLLGLCRLLGHDQRTFTPYINPSHISELLHSPSRPAVYLAIRVLALYLQGADHWFECMVKEYLGEDLPESSIKGPWDDIDIDYRFLTLWEEERHERVQKLIAAVSAATREQTRGGPRRILTSDNFDASVALVGGICLPRVPVLSQSSGNISSQVVETETIGRNLKAIARATKSPQPLLLTGLAGSGKTALTRHIALKLGKLNQMVTLHLNEQSDAKLLIGIYTTGETQGSFVWKPGVLTTAVREGRWVLIEDLDRAPTEIIGTLLPLIEKGELLIPNRKQTIHAAQGFRIIATVRSTTNHRGDESSPLSHMLGARLWQNVHIQMPSLIEQHEIAKKLFPSLHALLPQFLDVYNRLQNFRAQSASTSQSKTGMFRPISPRDLLKWCNRAVNLLKSKKSFTSSDMDDSFLEAIDCFLGFLPGGAAKTEMAASIAEVLHIDPQRRDYLLTERDAQYAVDKSQVSVGRYSLSRSLQAKKSTGHDGTFSTNPHTTRMLERVAAAVINREPLLLVGETGVGKTTSVQHLASHLSKKLVPFNLSQQSEAGDLLGGFKPVNARSLMMPMKDEFDDLFTTSFSRSKNQEFLELLGRQMAKSHWKAVCKLWQRALKMVEQQRSTSTAAKGEAPSKKRKMETKRTIDFERWDNFSTQVADMEKRLAAGSDAFAFSFVEGSIVKAVRNGDWILLDEINLASMDTLESIADLLDPSSPSILLTEAGDIERIDAHAEFRVFAAMNPATDVGKKDLPPGIRSRFTELYVESPDKDIRSLQSIVRSYLRHETATDQEIPRDVSTLYQKVIVLSEQNKLVDGAGQKPHFSLRTLTRTLSYAKYIAPLCSLRRALYEGFQMSFLTFLDVESARLVQPLLEQHLFGKRTNVRAELQKALRKPHDSYGYVQGWPGSKHWVRQGGLQLEDQPHYILTPFIRSNIENLVRATSTRQFPVLIQGPTSSGKTSMIEYLAKRTGHKFVRINNHEHTDLQEYLGTYISGTDGKLQFTEGILVKALREGHWIVLDELNLAPTDVLEALNRLLDDNRELLIPETQEVVRPHENFMLFATQNPAGLYGGRKTLSRAFRNRFLELHFDDIPADELQEILHRRTQQPESRCKRIVAVYRDLSVLRQESRLFEQKSFATLRDLFRWALRPNDTIEQLAANGFMLLAERVRKPEERQVLKEVIEKAMSAKGPRVSIDEQALYARECNEVLQYQQAASSQGVVWTKAMRRLYVLVSRAIANNEPVLLVGETGCGKTTVCQMLADAFSKELHTINAHQNTETGDLIGSQRPIRNRAAVEASLRKQLAALPFLRSLQSASGQSTDALLEAYDDAISAMSKDHQIAHLQTQEHAAIQTSRIRFKALFEWADGSLVQAMRSGAFFLLDEISLADDSVLERINSVLEPQRSILLAEKGSLDSFVTAAPDFQFFATMNPGGDYGKRELSPALRNRFTEIWVPSLNDADDVIEIVTVKLVDPATPFANAIVSFAQWFKEQHNTSASSSVSIRDALAWVSFINTASTGDNQAAVVHGAAMVYIDTLGANPAGLMTMTRYSLDEERQACLVELSRLLQADAHAIYSASTTVYSTASHFVAGGFCIAKRQAGPTEDLGFSFDPPTTKVNTMRVVRALQLHKPVMLEGNPGVGKTALVTAIAEAACVPLTRINLSEQTDLIDLFGSDVPVEGADTGSFAWRDAPFLRAMKNGEWVLLDEMNLASQSVLEGLNACLDHRGEVFVPELGQTFTRHLDFRLFAAQNPHHQGGGRKGLPASFVNRFTVVYADAFKAEDLVLICRRRFPSLEEDLVAKAVRFVEQLEYEVTTRKRIGANGGPWEFNLRDVSRWLALASSDQGLLNAGSARDFVDFLFSQRFRSSADRVVVSEIFERVFCGGDPRTDLFPSLSTQALQLGLGLLPRSAEDVPSPRSSIFVEKQVHHSRILESLMLCVQQNWPVILTGSPGSGKTAVIERLASAVGAPLVTIAMNAETDAMDLVGGYEQFDPHRQTFQAIRDIRQRLLAEVRRALTSSASASPTDVLTLLRRVESTLSSEQLDVGPFVKALQTSPSPAIREIAGRLHTISANIDKARFEWIDGLLVDALQQGKWLVLDNANLCSSSVLDRLNSLLEPNGSLIINEHSTDDGAARAIRPHSNFRVFMTFDPRYGELSRAMRNRAVELHLSKDPDCTSLDPLFTESAVARLQAFKAVAYTTSEAPTKDLALVLEDHLAACDQPLLTRFKRQLDNGLFGDNKLFAGSSLAPPTLLQRAQPFHEDLIGQSQGPADFASVQTLHPLNNQPLISTSPQTLSQASSLAVLFDLQVSVASMQQLLQSLQSNTSLVRQLRRLEQSWNVQSGKDGRESKDSQVVALLRQVVACLSGFAQSSSVISENALQSARMLFGQLETVWKFIYDALEGGQVDQAIITSFLSIASKWLYSHSLSQESALTTLLPQLSNTFDQLVNTTQGTRGLACAALWHALRPVTPPTLDQLRELLNFEGLVDRFDRLYRTSKMTLDEAVELKIQLSEALRVARHGGRDLSELTEKLQGLGLGADNADETKALRSSHFLRVFQRLHERFASVEQNVLTVEKSDLVRLEISAQHPTTQSRLSAGEAHFYSLPSRLQQPSSDAGISQSGETTLTMRVASADQVSLAELESFTVETRLLGKILSSQAHVLSAPELDGLDRCLNAVFSEFLSGLECSDDEQLASIASEITWQKATALSKGDHKIPLSHWAVAALHDVGRYLRAPAVNDTMRSGLAAAAWTSFALAALHLYLPGAQFDPALEPLLRVRVHRRHLQNLSDKLKAVQTLRSTLIGEPASLRARTIEEDMSALGPEPEAASVCRPTVSALSRLQSEFDTLSRTLKPAQRSLEQDGSPRPLDETALANLDRTRSRLKTQHRAYDDLTEPAVLFIDCLRIGNDLAVQSKASTDSPGTLAKIVPFADASLATWLRDEIFLQAAQHSSNIGSEIGWLSALALRCKVRPLQRCSHKLRARVTEAFQKFHAIWRAELSEDQKKNAAKSSLYKFKGNEDHQIEPSQDDLDEIFPTDTCDSAAGSSSPMQDQAPTIANLHTLIHGLSPSVENGAPELLRQWLSTSSTDPLTDGSSHLLPAAIFSLGELYESLSTTVEARRNYNMYVDSNLPECRRLYWLLQKIQRRFEELKGAWPEHATPGEVLLLCSQVFAVPYSGPLPRFFSLLEKIHATVTEWQKIASREYSAVVLLDELTNMIISWRQLELSAWAGIFEREWAQCEKTACSWWFVAYESIVASVTDLEASERDMQKHAEDLLRTLSDFMSASGLGEYAARLHLLRGFEAFFAASRGKTDTSRVLHAALQNFIAFYAHFEEPVSEALLKGRRDLEKDAKNIIQVASWKDRNIDVLRQSSQSSHRKLLKLIKKYRSLLAQPVTTIVQGGLPDKASVGLYTTYKPLKTMSLNSIDEVDNVVRLEIWNQRADRFRNAERTAGLVRSKTRTLIEGFDGQDQLQSFGVQLDKDIASLQKATPTLLTEKNKTLVNHLKTRKRRLLADVLKEARAMGFQTSMNMQTLSSQASSDRILARLPSLGQRSEDLQIDFNASELYRLADIMTTVRQAARNHSEDLTSAEVSRSVSLLESMLQQSTLQYSDLSVHASAYLSLQAVNSKLLNFATCEELSGYAEPRIDEVLEPLASLLTVLPICIQTLRRQMIMAGLDYSSLITSLMDCETEAQKLRLRAESLPSLPSTIESNDHTAIRQAHKDLQQHMNDIVNDVSTQHPETAPIMTQLRRWMVSEMPGPSKASLNGNAHLDEQTWTSRLLEAADKALIAIQDAEKIRSPAESESSWLMIEQRRLSRTLDSLQITALTASMRQLLSDVQYLNDMRENGLKQAQAMCRSVSPIIESYAQAVRDVLALQSSHHGQVTRTAYKLAKNLTSLCQKGFCTPSDKSDDKDSSEGNVESGTGLGDGEGAEDISKDIAPDEDLSELAQEAKREQRGDEIEEEKDAVDMADEDLEGELGDSDDPKDAEGGDGSGDDADEDGAIDEESGQVDDEGSSAVDEKMWDSGKDENQREKDTDKAKGQTNDDDVAAGQEGSDEHGEEQADGGAEETEDVQREATEQIDPHTREEDNLDLPEDLAMDNEKAAETDGSDLESISDVTESMPEAGPDAEHDQRQEDTAARETDMQQEEDEASKMEAGDEAAEEDAASDILMQDSEQQIPDEDPQTNAIVPPEPGSGTDQAEASEQDGAQGKPAGGPSTGKHNEEEDDNEQERTGAQAPGENSSSSEGTSEEHKLPFKQIGDALREWYNQNADIEKATQPDRSENTNESGQQPASTQFQHLPNEDIQADTQAIGTASAEESMALDKNQALPVNEESKPDEVPFQDAPEDGVEDNDNEKTADDMQLEPSDNLRREAQSSAFVGEPQNGDIEMTEGPETSEDNELDDMDQQLLETHISHEEDVEETTIDEARKQWATHEQSTRNLALVLTEHLRLILQPTQATKMRGDFRTGKRLNIKRIIPYIASSYKRDKIWMRRSVPSKRAYQIMLAIDDSRSMMESESRHLAFETLAMVTKSLSMLEVGELSVVGFGEEVKIAHDFNSPFSSDSGAEIFRRLAFTQNKTNVRKLLAESIELFRAARLKASSSASDLWQLQLIVSDGICEDHALIRQLVRQAREERIMIVFIVVDAAAQSKAAESGTKQSILDLQTAEFAKDATGEMQLNMVNYLDTFPFKYYLIVRDVQELPGVLAGALRQWFAEVVETSG